MECDYIVRKEIPLFTTNRTPDVETIPCPDSAHQDGARGHRTRFARHIRSLFLPFWLTAIFAILHKQYETWEEQQVLRKRRHYLTSAGATYVH